jgi:hypothetical protein
VPFSLFLHLLFVSLFDSLSVFLLLFKNTPFPPELRSDWQFLKRNATQNAPTTNGQVQFMRTKRKLPVFLFQIAFFLFQLLQTFSSSSKNANKMSVKCHIFHASSVVIFWRVFCAKKACKLSKMSKKWFR